MEVAMTSRERVMVISHQPSLALRLADGLAADGYEVATVADGREALDLLPCQSKGRRVGLPS